MARGEFQKGYPFETAFFFYPAPADLSTELPLKIRIDPPAGKPTADRKEVRYLKTNSLETTDIFRGAYFLCRGGELSEIRFRGNGKPIASFLFAAGKIGDIP